MIKREDVEKQGIRYAGFVPNWMLLELNKISKASMDFSLEANDGSNFLMLYNKKYELGYKPHKSNDMIMNFLTNQGVNLHSVNNNNENILFYCSYENICYWIRKGVDVYVENNKGQTNKGQTVWDIMSEYILGYMKNARSVYEKTNICFDDNKISDQRKIL